jgi:dTDP-4-amino-4,6-dideoxygalactose transaminase
LPGFVARRRELARRYEERLPECVGRIATGAGVEHGYHLFVVRVRDRDRVRARLREEGILTGVHYPHAIHRMRGYGVLGMAAGSQPHSERLADEVLSLPLFPELTEDSVDRVAEALLRVVN